MRNARTVIVALVLVTLSAAVPASAQTIPYTFSVFQRYLESYREQYGIPGMSAVVMNDASADLRNWLAANGLTAYTTPLTEFMKAGGAAKCLTLRLPEGA